MAGFTLAGGSGLNELYNPSAIFVTPNGTLYILDSTNYRVQRWASGEPLGFIVAGGRGLGTAYTQIGTSYGLYVDNQYNVWVSEYSNHRVTRWVVGNTATGTRVRILCYIGMLINLVDRFRWLVVMVLVVQSLNSTIPGVFSSATSALCTLQIAITIGSNDGCWVRISRYRNVSHSYSLLGATSGTTVAGTGVVGATATQLSSPRAVIMDQFNYLYILDTGNNRVQRWLLGATSGVTIISSTTFSSPSGMRFSSPGNLIVADTSRHRVVSYPITCRKYRSCIIRNQSSVFSINHSHNHDNICHK